MNNVVSDTFKGAACHFQTDNNHKDTFKNLICNYVELDCLSQPPVLQFSGPEKNVFKRLILLNKHMYVCVYVWIKSEHSAF